MVMTDDYEMNAANLSTLMWSDNTCIVALHDTTSAFMAWKESISALVGCVAGLGKSRMDGSYMHGSIGS